MVGGIGNIIVMKRMSGEVSGIIIMNVLVRFLEKAVAHMLLSLDKKDFINHVVMDVPVEVVIQK
jgi:hypothetical protein